MILDIKDLSVFYRSKKTYAKALDKVSFSLKEGEILGLVGESGSGKSTLSYSVLGLLPQDSKKEGQIIFDKENIFSLSPKKLEGLRADNIGLIFQDPAGTFNPVLSIGYQFREVLESKLKITGKDTVKKIIADSFDQVRLPDAERILKSYPHQLSGGQLQRVAIAIAISLKPRILIADEPTSSLDVTIESQIINLFKELKDKLNLTIIFITHNLDLVRALCDRVVVLYQGEVREINSTEEIFKNPQDNYTRELLVSLQELE